MSDRVLKPLNSFTDWLALNSNDDWLRKACSWLKWIKKVSGTVNVLFEITPCEKPLNVATPQII